MLHNTARNSLDTGKTTPNLGEKLSMVKVGKAITEYVRSRKS